MPIEQQVAPTVSTPITLTARKLSRNPYIQLAAKVAKANASLQANASEVAALLSAQLNAPLTARQTARLQALYSSMDRSEKALVGYLSC